MMDGLLIVRRLQVHGANTLAGLTWGFPSITQFLGYVHALQRRLPDTFDLQFTGCAVVCHEHQCLAQIGQGAFTDTRFALARHPLKKEGKTAAIVEEGRMNFTVSLLIAVADHMDMDNTETQQLLHYIRNQAGQQHLAGGIVTNQAKVEYFSYDTVYSDHQRLMRILLPGFALVSRHALLCTTQTQYQAQAQQDAAWQAWLDFSTWRSQANDTARTADDNTNVHWKLIKRSAGWLVPISVGYRGIAPLQAPGTVANVRDNKTPVHFVENIYSLGEWLNPCCCPNIDALMWRYHWNGHGDYLCINDYTPEHEEDLSQL